MYTWNKTIENPKGNILFLHGYGEYSLRYTELAEISNIRGYNFYSLDYKGFGKSDGLPGYIHSVDDIVTDVQNYITTIQDLHGFYFPLFLIGHSMGANVALQTAFRDASIFKAIYLSAPLVKIDTRKFTLHIDLFTSIWKNLFPFGFLCTSGLSKSDISRNPSVINSYSTDNYMYKAPIRVETANSLFEACRNVEKCKTLLLPIAIGVGSDDKVCNPKDIIGFYRGLKSVNKKLYRYKGLYHELLLEPEREIVINDMLQFFEKMNS